MKKWENQNLKSVGIEKTECAYRGYYFCKDCGALSGTITIPPDEKDKTKSCSCGGTLVPQGVHVFPCFIGNCLVS